MRLVDQRAHFRLGVQRMPTLIRFTRSTSRHGTLGVLSCTSRRLDEVQRSPFSE
jgi:hypothetical protein